MASNNSTVSYNPSKAESALEAISPVFVKIMTNVNLMTSNVTDLQKNFWSPDGKGAHTLYTDYKTNLGASGSESGLYPAIQGAFQWCSAVDDYLQQFEKANNDDNKYTNS